MKRAEICEGRPSVRSSKEARHQREEVFSTLRSATEAVELQNRLIHEARQRLAQIRADIENSAPNPMWKPDIGTLPKKRTVSRNKRRIGHITSQSAQVNFDEESAENDTRRAPPRLGELLLCLLVRSDRQKDRLGDLEETFNTIWLPRFPLWVAKCVYFVQVLRTGVTVAISGAVMAAIDKIWHVWSR